MEEVFRNEKFLWILTLVSIIVSSLIISTGDWFWYSVFLILTTSIVSLSFLFSVTVVKSLKGEFHLKFVNAIHAWSYSLVITSVFLIIWPYLIFRDMFYNTYVAQWVYGMPVIFLVVTLFFVFYSLVAHKKVRIIPFIGKAVLVSVIVSCLGTLALGIVISVASNTFNESYYLNVEEITYDHSKQRDLNSAVLIFQELISLRQEISEELSGLKFERKSSGSLCYSEECVYIAIGKIYDSTELGSKVYMYNLIEKTALEELQFIEYEQYLTNYSSLEEYSQALSLNAEDIGFIENPELAERLSFDEYKQSPFYHYAKFEFALESSLEYVIERTTLNQALVLLASKMTQLRTENTRFFFSHLSEIKEDESIKSQTVRLKILNLLSEIISR